MKLPATDESRWLRVERKALVFFPTLNKRLSNYQRTIPANLRRGRFAIAREFLHAPHSLPRWSVCDSGRDMSIDMRATFCLHRFQGRQRDQKIQLVPTTVPLDGKSLPVFFRRSNLRGQSSQCRAK